MLNLLKRNLSFMYSLILQYIVTTSIDMSPPDMSEDQESDMSPPTYHFPVLVIKHYSNCCGTVPHFSTIQWDCGDNCQ